MSLWMMNKQGEPYLEPDDRPEYWQLEHGMRHLRKAVELWQFLGSSKARQLEDIMKYELSLEDEDERQVISLDQLQRILALLDGLGAALRSVTSPEYDLKPEDVERAQRQWKIVHHWKNPDGSEVYTVGNALSEVRDVEQFFRRALEEGRRVLID